MYKLLRVRVRIRIRIRIRVRVRVNTGLRSGPNKQFRISLSM